MALFVLEKFLFSRLCSHNEEAFRADRIPGAVVIVSVRERGKELGAADKAADLAR